MTDTKRLYLLVSLRARDLAALTAEETIRRRVAGGGHLDRLDRADLWEFDSDGAGVFRDGLERLVRESNLFVNPNKHTFRFTGDYRTGWTGDVTLVTVRGREDLDGAVARETLETRYHLPGLRDVRYASLWVMRFTGVAPGERAALAESLAVTTGPKGGLLVNPHYQEWAVEDGVPEVSTS